MVIVASQSLLTLALIQIQEIIIEVLSASCYSVNVHMQAIMKASEEAFLRESLKGRIV